MVEVKQRDAVRPDTGYIYEGKPILAGDILIQTVRFIYGEVVWSEELGKYVVCRDDDGALEDMESHGFQQVMKNKE